MWGSSTCYLFVPLSYSLKGQDLSKNSDDLCLFYFVQTAHGSHIISFLSSSLYYDYLVFVRASSNSSHLMISQ